MMSYKFYLLFHNNYLIFTVSYVKENKKMFNLISNQVFLKFLIESRKNYKNKINK